MSSFNWPRIILGGLVVGGVFSLLSAVLVGTLGSEFLAAVGAHASDGRGSAQTGPGLYFATVFSGLWAMWLYAVVRPHFSGNLGAVVTVSLGWWLIASIQSMKWILLLELPPSVVLPLTGNVIPTMIAVFVGSVLYGSEQPNQPHHPAR